MILVMTGYIHKSANNSPASIRYDGKLFYRDFEDNYFFYTALRYRIVINERPINMPVDMLPDGSYLFLDGNGVNQTGIQSNWY